MNVVEFLETSIATNKNIQNGCGLNERQVLRELKKLGDRVVKIASGRSPKYALTINSFGVGDRINLWEVDGHGKHTCIAVIRPLSVGGFFVQKRISGSKLLLGEAKNGLYDDLPFFLRDMAPQGFLGRKIARELSTRDDAIPNNPEYWNNNHIGEYLLTNSDDALGDLKLGNSANLRFKSNVSRSTSTDYPALAKQAMSDDVPISSAGGEQPKFITFCAEQKAHVMVKFSPKGNDKVAIRWRDILISEFHANEVLNTGATTAATTRLIEEGDRLFLESIRFDRIGENGRSSMISLKSIDAEFVGSGENWVSSLIKLESMELVSSQDVLNGQWLRAFGKLINNTDMHLGNMSLSIHGDVFNLLPIYDMCSMGFAPRKNGEVMPFSFTEPDLADEGLSNDLIRKVKKLADKYWCNLSNDPRISDDFREFLKSSLLGS
ncbi:MAG: hypothetical protein A6F71_05215 [Cycloclasticus sp. symbiont of Poecilosclerida sp. M]|nr:MAG: hypothetical protein A6F71_05215 [Cycloclasticus sp. symbiont of Poecilosclerida sp. M]